MVAFNTIKVGDTLYSVSSGLMGNTTIRTKRCHPVSVKEIDAEKGRIFASWNGNAPRWMWPDAIRRLRRSPIKER